jgi:hypothetical protein
MDDGIQQGAVRMSIHLIRDLSGTVLYDRERANGDWNERVQCVTIGKWGLGSRSDPIFRVLRSDGIFS